MRTSSGLGYTRLWPYIDVDRHIGYTTSRRGDRLPPRNNYLANYYKNKNIYCQLFYIKINK